jgi:hypothetical protein
MGATSSWRETRWRGSTNLPLDPLAPPVGSLRALASGEHVSVGLWWSNWCGRGSRHNGDSGLPPAAIVFAAPGGGAIALRNGGETTSRVGAPPCYAHTASTLSATRFTPYVPQGPPSSELPLRAQIVSGPPLVIKGEQISQPSLVARRGAWLFFTVVLTNRSRQTFTFGRTCPAYTEGIGASQNEAYVLNCHAVGSIGPRHSVRFAMRIRVPRHISLKFPALGWSLAPHSWNYPQTSAVLQVR